MYHFQVTKYNPEKRNDLGHYLDADEWTEYSDVGKTVTLNDYKKVETAYIETAIEFFAGSEINELQVVDLEDYNEYNEQVEGILVRIEDMGPVLMAILRNKYWCKLESDRAYLHVGWDFYMYIGVQNVSSSIESFASERGLFVERFISPYLKASDY